MSWVSTTAYLQALPKPVTVTKVNLDAENSNITTSWINHVTNKNSSFGIRVSWLIFILAANIICVLHSTDRIWHYISNPSRVDIHDVQNNTIRLPAITICPAGGAPSLNYNLVKTRYPNVHGHDIWNQLDNGKISLTEFWNLCKVELMNVSAINYDDAQESKTNIKEPLNVSEITTPIGICHQIKFSTNLKQFTNRLLFVLEGWEESARARTVTLNEPEDTPFDLYFYHRNGVIIPDRGDTKYGTRIVEVSIIAKSVSRNISKDPCETNEYVATCLAHCYETVFISRVVEKVCRLPFMQHFDNSPLCTSKKDVEDMMAATKNASIEFDPETCKCRKKCRKISYTLDYTYTTGIKSGNVWRFEVNVPTGRITMLKEETAYTSFDAFADLGGCLGLWLGLCFLDVLEFGTLYFSKACSKMTYNENKTNTNSLRGRRFRIVVVRDADLKADTIPAADLPGFRNAIKRKSPLWIRFLWLAVSMVALFICVYQCIERIDLYFSDPSTVNVKYVSDTIVPFPSIMVCPKRSDGITPALSTVRIQETLGKPHTYKEILQFLSKGQLALDDIWNMSSIAFNYTLQWAYSENYEWISSMVPTILGNCLTFIPKATINFKDRRPVQILRGNLNYEPGRNLLVCVYQPQDLALVNYLFQLDCNEIHRENSEGLLDTAFQITQVSYRNLQKNPCSDREQVVKCITECIERKISLKIPQGNCRIPFMARTTFDCNSTTGLPSLINATLNTVGTLKREDCICFRACKESLYNKEYTTISKVSSARTLVVQINIWNKEIMVMEEMSAYSIFSLFSDLGGSIGLFTGLCVMSLLEVLANIFSKLLIVMKSLLHLKKSKQRIRPQGNHRQIIMLEGSLSNLENKNQAKTVLEYAKFEKTSVPMWNRILWLLIFVGLFCPCMHLCLERVMYFISDPTVTETYYSQNITIAFPVMLICDQFEMSLYGVRSVEGSYFQYWRTPVLHSAVETLVNNKLASKDDIIISNISTTIGNCFMITAQKPVKYVGYSTFINMVIKYMHRSFGWMVAVPADRVPLLRYLTPRDCYFASSDVPTTHTFLTVKITEVIRRNTRNHPCENSLTVTTCLAKCMERKIFDHPDVKCRLPFMQESKTYSLCLTQSEYLAASNATRKVIDNFDKANCNCGRECRTTMYSVDEIKFGYYHRRGLGLEIRIPENSFPTTKEEAAYSFIKLLSDLGGSLGLFFGLGVIQTLELLEDTTAKLKMRLNFPRLRSFLSQ